jgi:uncharacterized membrane protein
MRFTTLSYPFLTKLHNEFYVDRTRVIPQNIGDYLTAGALAYWIMDDGNASHDNKGRIKGVALNTQNFSEEDVNLLIKVMKSNFG